MRTTLWSSLIILIVAIVLSLLFYAQVPERVDSHWDAQGRVNGTMTRFWGMFLIPLMMIGISILMFVLPRVDPLNPNFTGFEKYYYAFIVVFNLFMLLVHSYMVLWNAQVIRFSINGVISLGTGFLLYAAGVLVKNAKRNWFAGIRTPWTLSSDSVWEKTHLAGSYLFKGAGVLIAVSSPFPKLSIWIVLVSSLGVSLGTMVYSYILYRKENHT